MQLGSPGAVEDRVEPVIPLEPLGGLVFIGRQGHQTHPGSAFDLDETDLDGGLGVFGVRPARDSRSRGSLSRRSALAIPAIPRGEVTKSTAIRSMSASSTMGASLGYDDRLG